MAPASRMHSGIVLPCVVSVYHLVLQRDVVHSLYMHALLVQSFCSELLIEFKCSLINL